MGFSPAGLIAAYGRTIKVCAYSLITISAMLAIGTLTRLSGIDATLGLAFAATGLLYPFFGTLLGWLGVALTGPDTASNILFGNLQRITSEQLGISPILMSAANSSGGVIGKMIDAQSIVVASTATNWFGHEGTALVLPCEICRQFMAGRNYQIVLAGPLSADCVAKVAENGLWNCILKQMNRGGCAFES